MKTKDIEEKVDSLGFKLIKVIFDETIMLSQKHEVAETITMVKLATILAVAATASSLSRMLMHKNDRDAFLVDYKSLVLEVLDKAADIKASDLVRH